VYWEGLQQIRQSGGDESSERALAREVFVWRPGPTASAIQGLRKAKAWLRYRFRS